MATAENITPRKVLQDLGYAPRLNAPEPIMQPTPQAPLPARDTETTQLVNALAEVNKQVGVYAEIYTNQREQSDIQDAAANSIKLLNEARANQTKTGQSLNAYIESNAGNYGSSPTVRKTLFTMIGERTAAEDYTKILDENRNRVLNTLKPENPDDVIGEARQKFLAKLGDNMFSRAGAESVMNRADNAFRSEAQTAQDQFMQVKMHENMAIKIQQTVTEGLGLNNPEATATNLHEILRSIKAAGVKDAPDAWAKYVKQAFVNLAVKDNGPAVRSMIEALKSNPISTINDKGETAVIGKFGDSALWGSYFNELESSVLKASTDAEDMASAQFNTRQRTLKETATTLVQSVVGEYPLNQIDDPTIQAKIDSEIEKKAATSAELASLRQWSALALKGYRESVQQPSSPQHKLAMQEAKSKFDYETFSTLFNLLPPQEKANGYADYQAFLNGAKLVNNPEMTAAATVLNSQLITGLKAETADTPDYSIKFDLITQAKNDFYATVDKKITDAQPTFKDKSDSEVRKIIGDIRSSVGTEIVQKYLHQYNSMSGAAAASKDPSSFKAPPVKGAVPVSTTKVYSDEEKFKAASTWAPLMQQLKEQSPTLNFQKPETVKLAMQAEESIKNMWASMAPEFVTMSRFGTNKLGQAIGPQARESATESYIALKTAVGFNPQEIINGRTSDGIAIDVPTLTQNNPNFPYVTKFFPNKQAFVKSINEYATLANQLSMASTEEEKQALQIQLKQTPYYQLTNKLIPSSGAASLDAAVVNRFNENQQQMLSYASVPDRADVISNISSNISQAITNVKAGPQVAGVQAPNQPNKGGVQFFPSAQEQAVTNEFKDIAIGKSIQGVSISGDLLQQSTTNALTSALAVKFNTTEADVAANKQKYVDLFSVLAPKERSMVYEAVVSGVRMSSLYNDPVLRLFVPQIKLQASENTNNIATFFGLKDSDLQPRTDIKNVGPIRNVPTTIEEFKQWAKEVGAPAADVAKFYAPKVAEIPAYLTAWSKEMAATGQPLMDFYAPNAGKTVKEMVNPTAAAIASEVAAPGSSLLKNVVRNPAKEAANTAALKKTVKAVAPVAAGVASEIIKPGSSVVKNVKR